MEIQVEIGKMKNTDALYYLKLCSLTEEKGAVNILELSSYWLRKGCIPDIVNNAKFLRDIYFKAAPNYSGSPFNDPHQES